MADEVYEIYPAIGIARVGNAPEAFYNGPETAGGLPLHADGSSAPFGAGDFRDEEGRVKRQAARFRIFRRAPGEAPQEITLDSGAIREIRWTVHLANKKASWYCFQTSRGQHGYACNHPLRNADRVTPAERRKLNIDPGPRRIAGRDRGPVEFSRSTVPAEYAGACFPPTGLKPVDIDTLGTLKTDAAGRLLVLGGLGKSGTTAEEPKLANYANNDGWWDDTSDGPVRVTILLHTGEVVEAKPAWVLVAPPAYAPQILNLVTLFDTVFDTAVRFLGARPDIHDRGLWQAGAGGYRPRFDSEIRPIFERGAGFPWVSPIPAGPHSFDFAKLADPSPASADLRKFYLDILRGPGQENVFDSPVSATGMMPLLVGDDTIGAERDSGGFLGTSKYLRLTDTQYFFLQQWAAGHFEPAGATSLDPGHALSRAVLENCVGGPYSPGIEMTWIARNPAIYGEPFRIRARPPSGGSLSLGFDPAGGLEPGDLTRYMALPWQADFNECAAQTVEGRVMWWWPAQRPITVFQPPAAGTHELDPPVPWIGHDSNSKARDFYAFADHLEMLANWDKLGFVLDAGEPGNPRFVEVARLLARAASKTG
jgi:hypothetical protein